MAKMGRPTDNPRTERIGLRLAPNEKEKIIECTKKYKVKIIDLIMMGIESLEKK